jgi:hypothetical protein
VRQGAEWDPASPSLRRDRLYGTFATYGATHWSHESHRSDSDLSRRLASPKRDQFPLAANFACFLAGLACGEPEGCNCGPGVGLLFGLFIAIN